VLRRGPAPAIWIVFSANNWDIFRTTIDGSEIITLADHERNEVSPTPSPDGEWIAFTGNRILTGPIMKMRRDGSGVSVVSEGFGTALSPAWSPDSEWIVFVASSQLYKVRPDGSDYQRLTNSRMELSGPTWSPDGEWITFTARIEPNNRDIYRMRPDGSDFQPFITGPFMVIGWPLRFVHIESCRQQ
jgi:TolB protein